jgi:hypothetical protein
MNGFIYAIKNTTSDDVYIGSTTQDLRRRFTEHKCLPHSTCRSKEILKCTTAYIEYIEGCDIDKMKEREQYWIDNTPNCINKRNVNVIIDNNYFYNYNKQWRINNRERFIEQRREYYKNNMELINQKRREYRSKKKITQDT